ASRRRLERTAMEVERKHQDGEARRRYIETILKRAATGVVSVDGAGRLGTVNPAAARLLGVAGDFSSLPMSAVFGAPELKPRAIPTDLHALLNEAVALNERALPDIHIHRRFAASLPTTSVDPDQIRRVIVNVMDNAIEAMEQRGDIDIETQHDQANNLVRIV